MEIEPIAHVEGAGTIVFEPKYRDRNALRGIDGFSHLWIIWGSAGGGAGTHDEGAGQRQEDAVGNGLALTAVVLEGVEGVRGKGTVLHVAANDPVHAPVPEDGAPVFDIKPYVAYTDAHE